MPSIASYVNDLLNEPMYGVNHKSTYNEKIQQRVANWNAAQLQGLHSHLDQTQKKATFPLWKSVNQKLIGEMTETLKQRSDAIRAEIKRKEDEKMKQFQVKEKKKQKKVEAARVMNTILKNAHIKATKEIEIEEQLRSNAERAEIQARIFKADEKQEKYGYATAFYFIGGMIGMLAAGLVWYITTAVCVFIFLSTIYLCWKLYNMTKIIPLVVTPEQIASRIEERSALIKVKLIDEMRESERKFQERLIRDKIEKKYARIRRIKDEKKRAEQEAQLKAEWEGQQNQMALEILEKIQSTEQVAVEKKAEVYDENAEIICPINLRSLVVYDLPHDRVIFNHKVYATVSILYKNTHDYFDNVNYRQGKTFEPDGAKKYHAANEIKTVWKSEYQKWLGDDNDWSFDANNIDGKNEEVSVSQSHIKKAKDMGQLNNVYLNDYVAAGGAFDGPDSDVPHGLTVSLEREDVVIVKVYSRVKYDKEVQVGECWLDSKMLFEKNSKTVDPNATLSIDFPLSSIYPDQFGYTIGVGHGTLYLQYLNTFEEPEEEVKAEEEEVEEAEKPQRTILHDLHLISAKELPHADGIFGTADPYILAKYGATEVGRTPVVKRNLNPIWENVRFPLSISTSIQEMSIESSSLSDKNSRSKKSSAVRNGPSAVEAAPSESSPAYSSSTLTVEAWDWDLIGRPNFLGGCEVPFDELNNWMKESEGKMGTLVVRQLKLGKLSSLDNSISQELINGKSTVEIGINSSELVTLLDETKEEPMQLMNSNTNTFAKKGGGQGGQDELEVVDVTDWNAKDDDLDKLEAGAWLASELQAQGPVSLELTHNSK